LLQNMRRGVFCIEYLQVACSMRNGILRLIKVVTMGGSEQELAKATISLTAKRALPPSSLNGVVGLRARMIMMREE